MGGEVVHDYDPPCSQAQGEDLVKVGLTYLAVGGVLHRQRSPLIPSIQMLTSRVVFFPRLRDPQQGTRSPRRDRAPRGKREVFAAISSTKTNRAESALSENVTLQRTLRHSSRPVAPTLRF
jgi:hypothetical protein